MENNERLSNVLTFAREEWETMTLLFQATKEDLGQKMLLTKPDEHNVREELYYTARAIDAVAIKLQECINICKSNQGDY